MAQEFIYGCVEDDFSITVEHGDPMPDSPNCVYSACMIWEGVHARQVSITIDNLNCSDTYYGCVNWATKKFRISVPEICSWLCCECGTESFSNSCYATDEVPKAMYVKFSGVKFCNGAPVTDLNDKWICLPRRTGLGYGNYPYGTYGWWRGDSGNQWEFDYRLVYGGTDGRMVVRRNAAAGSRWIFMAHNPVPDPMCFKYSDNMTVDYCAIFGGYDGHFIATECDICVTGTDWVISTDYDVSDTVLNDGACYICIQDHTSSSSDEPGTGANWEDYWEEVV